jgi:hypothetical protein
VIKRRRMRWGEYKAQVRKMRNAYKIFVQHIKGKTQLEDLDIDGMVIFDD